MKGLCQLVRNLCYLSKFSLKERVLNNEFLNRSYNEFLKELLENFLYYIDNSKVKRPNLFTPEETIQLLVNSNKSIVRFGDGELYIINGQGLDFQKYDEDLASRLKDILRAQKDDLLIGISYWCFFPNVFLNTDDASKYCEYFEVPKIRKFYFEYIRDDIKYCDANFTGWNFSENPEKTYSDLKKIWENKNIVIVTCKEILSNIKYNIYENASKIDYVYVPNVDAYSEYEKILSEVKKWDKDTLVILMCGPAAKVLAFDLYNSGYRVLDLGHLLKSYDYYKKNTEMTSENIEKFYGADV